MMSEYVRHKLSLKKLLSKLKLKDPLLSFAVADDSAVVAEDPSPAEPALQVAPPTSLDIPVIDTDVSEYLSGISSDIVTQVQSVFANFAKSLERRFSTIAERFSQVLSSSSSKVPGNMDNVSQNVNSSTTGLAVAK